MRPRRLAFAAALVLGACTGGGPPPAATPEASPAAEAPSTPAPTAIATPEATPPPSPAAVATPEPPPEAACANGVAVEEPEARPGLVADCVALLASRDALRGEAALDWGADLAIGRWEGVAVEGEPPRVTGLDLRDKGLTGSIPRGLRRLRLDEVRLAGNALTGCVPSAFGDARGDAAYLGLPWCLRYARLDATGEVAEAGEWAILGAGGEVLATWEGLRSEAATLRVHQTDAGGTSWASEFGAVSEGDLFEWRKASDCWVRYHVTGDPVRPSGGSGRWEFPVEWMTYAAAEGDSCTGDVGAAAVLSMDEAAPSVIPAIAVAGPVLHGPYQFYPVGWAGDRARRTMHLPAHARGAQTAAVVVPNRSPDAVTSDPAEAARLFPYWRTPALPAGWTLSYAESGAPYSPVYGHCAMYNNDRGFFGVEICIYHKLYRGGFQEALSEDGETVFDFHVIDGRPAIVWYSPRGPAHDPLASIITFVFDPETELEYRVWGYGSSLIGWDTDAALEIARSLLPSADSP